MITGCLKRVLFAALFAVCCTWIQPVFGQTADVPAPADAAAGDQSNSIKDKPVVFPVPSEADGAELLQYEHITFDADTTPMPDVAATVQSARENKDSASMFITHMLYRDNIGDIAYYNDGKKQADALSPIEMHREMIRWRDEAYEANYELALLARSPSVQYEISPLFANNDEFKKGLNWLKNAAAHGYGNAEYVLGLVYFNGVGVKRDKQKGFELLVRAAAHGVINAYYAVGMIYEMGLNGKKDTDKSFYWLDKAAHFDSKDAIFILAMKYADGIDVPKDAAKAAELEKLDPIYHAWTMLHAERKGLFFHIYCEEKYDESDIGSFYRTKGCEPQTYYNDRFKDEYTSDDEEEEPDTPDVVAAFSLDYKIDYRIAALWIKKVANLSREETYMLRSQTHHISGCRGELDGVFFEDILLTPYDASDDDYDDETTSYKLIVTALEDDHIKPSKVRKWLSDKVKTGDRDAILTIAQLYDGNSLLTGKDTVNRYGNRDLSVVLGYYKSNPSKHEIKKNKQKALEYYESLEAWPQCVSIAEELGDNEKALIWSERGYQYFSRNNNKASDNFSWMRTFADDAARFAHKLGEDGKALEYYFYALDANEKQKNPNMDYRFKTTLNIAKIYDSGASQVQDKAKALDFYQKALGYVLNSIYYSGAYFINERINSDGYFALNEESFYNYLGDLVYAAEHIGSILNEDTSILPDSKELLTETYQRLSELDAYNNSREDITREDKVRILQKSLKLAHKAIEALPKIELQKDIEKQILAEKGKNPDSFYIFKQVLSKCEQEKDNDYLDNNKYLVCLDKINDNAEDWCGYYTCRIDEPYKESIQKAILAITALSLASGTLNIDEINNTFYYYAIYKGWSSLSIDLRESSSVYSQLENFFKMVRERKEERLKKNNTQAYEFKDHDLKRLYNIWYLRQIPYAAADKFKKLNAPKTWNEYLSEAEATIQQNEQLRTAFGYDPAMIVQRFSVYERPASGREP